MRNETSTSAVPTSSTSGSSRRSFLNRQAALRANSQDGSIGYQVTGNMTIHGVTKQVTLPLRMLGEGKGPFNDQRSGFLCQVELKRSDFGMTNLLNVVGRRDRHYGELRGRAAGQCCRRVPPAR